MNTELIPQLWNSLCFLAAGILGAFVSDILFGVRCAARGKAAEILLDFGMLSFCAALIFLTSVSVVQDTLRGYMLAVFLLGVIVWEKTVGKGVRWLLCTVVRLLSKAVRRTKSFLLRRMRKGKTRLAARAPEKICKKNKKARKSTSIFHGNRLK